MYHHSAESYAVAASAAAKVARVKMEELIHRSQANAGRVIQNILDRQIRDRVVKTPAVKFGFGNDEWGIQMDGEATGLHKHAFSQVITDAQIPAAFATKLEEQSNGGQWGKELLAHNLNTIFGHRVKQRNLVRTEDDKVKGWLSDRFRRLDSRPLLDAFIGVGNEIGLVPMDGLATETKSRIRMILPQVFEPVDNEVMVFGLEWGNSDYGDGGHVVNLWMMRMWCTNLAITETALRQIHLGKKLEDGIQYSDRTYELDTKLNVSALGDVVRHAIGPAQINGMVKSVQAATEKEFKSRDGAHAVIKKYLTNKAEQQRAIDAYDGPDVTNLPAGNTPWRLSNLFSFLAQSEGISTGKKLEYQGLAGKVLPAAKALEVVEV